MTLWPVELMIHPPSTPLGREGKVINRTEIIVPLHPGEKGWEEKYLRTGMEGVRRQEKRNDL